MSNRVIYPPMSPAVSYYGGKQRLASRIVEQCLKIPHTVYCEPYCGGAAVYFAMPVMWTGNNDHYRVVLNDIDERLITFYRVAKTRPDELIQTLQATLYSKTEYDRSAAILKSSAEYDELTRAWAYYVNIQQSFSNKLFAGWARKVVTRNNAETWQNGLLELPPVIEKLSVAHIECSAALDCIDCWDSPQTLFYIDPPYPESNQGHYGGYSLDDWKRLCEKLDSIEGSYILSNYAQSVEPVNVQQRIEIDTTMTAAKAETAGNRGRTEVLWICDRSANARDELKPVFKRLQAALTKPQQVDLFGDVA